eukprot:jgi/Chlat1/2108/Chrsp17S02705
MADNEHKIDEEALLRGDESQIQHTIAARAKLNWGAGTAAAKDAIHARSSGEETPAQANTVGRVRSHIQEKHGVPQVSLRNNLELRKRFLIRLAIALHSYGSSASRTEHLIESSGERLGIKLSISVFPTLILLSFAAHNGDHPQAAEFHQLSVDYDLDLDKLGRADELAARVGTDQVPLLAGYWRLRAIASAPPEWTPLARVFAMMMLCAMAALLFFDGGVYDAVFCGMLGSIVGLYNWMASKSSQFSNVLEFITAMTVSFIAQLLMVYLPDLKLCFFAMALGSLVWLLPGLSLTIGVSEVSANSPVSGTSRLLLALVSALQLGFGLAIGQAMVFWHKHKSQQKCPHHDQFPRWLFLPGCLVYLVASNILLNSRRDQWPGMIVTGFAGYISDTFAGMIFPGSSTSVVSALVVSIVGSCYARATNSLPLAYTLSGILILVPGGVGVRGVEAMLEQNIISGLSFGFDMLMVGMSITIGLLGAKLLLPFGRGGHFASHGKHTLVRELDEDMAI